ncbi:MAG TPA: DUF1549 domain-containing protein, partial [Gemmatales bacterium]|nr:DUF1549 domain-containing protein [Gemmatales bacterium]
MKRRVLLICLLSLCLTGLCLVPSSQADTPAKTLYAERDVLAVSRELDGIIHHALTEAKVPPSGLSSDAEFMRRLSLDLCGRIPRPDRVIRFLEDKSPDKRRKLIEEFLSDPEYGEHFGIIWYHRLVKRTMDNTQIISNNFEDWLAQEFNKNTPWDEIVRKVLMAEGERDKNPPTVFYLAHSEGNKQPEVQPARVVATMSQMFMGVRLECCECHNQPFDDGLKQT